MAFSNSMKPRKISVLCATGLTFFSTGFLSCKQRSFSKTKSAESPEETSVAGPSGEWLKIYKARTDAINQYLKQNDAETKNAGEGFRWLRDFPLGFSGPPLFLFKALPEVYPDIFGQPEDNYRQLGFGHKIPKEWANKKNRSLPMGLGYTHTDLVLPEKLVDGSKTPLRPPVAIAVITCGGCHIGALKLRKSELGSIGDGYAGSSEKLENGGYIYMAGAPNTAFDSNRFRHAIERLVNHESFSPAKISETAATLQSKIVGISALDAFGEANNLIQSGTLKVDTAFEKKFVYKDAEAVKLILGKFKDKINARIIINENYADKVYGGPDKLNGSSEGNFNGTPGQLDAFGLANSVIASLQPANAVESYRAAHFPKGPGISDIMSVWEQNTRPYGNWNGNMKDKFYRNLGASFGGVADAAAVDTQNAKIVTNFLEELPAAAFPFNVEFERAQEGKKLFEANCSSCHGKRDESGNPAKWKWINSSIQFNAAKQKPIWINVGTDPGRTNVQNATISVAMRDALIAGCDAPHKRLGLPRDKEQCDKALDDVVTPVSVTNGGFIPLNMSGLWTRAPYLHNGSVPTLRALLTRPEDRPKTFIRGVQYYDTKNMGFVWDEEAIVKEFGPLAELQKEFVNVSRYNTEVTGFSNQGHYNLQVTNLAEVESSGAKPVISNNGKWPTDEKEIDDLLEYLKTF